MFLSKLISGLFLLFFGLACNNKESIMDPEPATPAASAKYTYLALGDSYTIGESVTTENRWTYYLASYLRQAGVGLADPITIARTGWTTSELQEAIRQSNETNTYDLVTLLIGVNNQYRGQSLEAYRLEFRDLLQTSIKFAAGEPEHVVVLSIPDWGVTPFADGRNRSNITQEIEAFNAVAIAECHAARVTFINITPISRKAFEDNSYIAADSLHFSGRMYAEWAAIAFPKVKAIFDE